MSVRNHEQGSTSAKWKRGEYGINFPRIYDLLIFLLTRGRGRAYRGRILELAEISPGDRVLDIGCGTGTFVIAAWPHTQPKGSVDGVDVSENMLFVARGKAVRAGLEIPFRQGSAVELPFESSRFDLVTVVTVMHMIPTERRHLALAEAARVLRPDGRLLLVDYAGDPWKRKHWSARHGPHGRFDLHLLREPLARAGFDILDEGPIKWLSLHFMRCALH